MFTISCALNVNGSAASLNTTIVLVHACGARMRLLRAHMGTAASDRSKTFGNREPAPCVPMTPRTSCSGIPHGGRDVVAAARLSRNLVYRANVRDTLHLGKRNSSMRRKRLLVVKNCSLCSLIIY